MIEYIGPAQLVIYYNKPRFDERIFNGDHIIRESSI